MILLFFVKMKLFQENIISIMNLSYILSKNHIQGEVYLQMSLIQWIMDFAKNYEC